MKMKERRAPAGGKLLDVGRPLPDREQVEVCVETLMRFWIWAFTELFTLDTGTVSRAYPEFRDDDISTTSGKCAHTGS